MPLNYSKWDNLELSDDSDIEVHPNVDKRSFIRWKQRDIHEKREQRKQELAALKIELETNQKSLIPMLKEIADKTNSEGHTFFARHTAQLKAGREARGNKDGPDGPTAEDMILSLLLQINEEDKVKGKTGTELDAALLESLKGHQSLLNDRTKEVKETIAKMEEEDKRKITSDSIREGWSSGYVAKAEDEPASAPASTSKGKSAEKETAIETINSPSVQQAQSSSSTAKKSGSGDDDDDDIPDATPTMLQFANLPAAVPPIPYTATALPAAFNPARHANTSAFEEAYKFLGSHRELLREGQGNATDALLVEAFNAEQKGQKEKSRKCVEKALLIQYCQKLGKDGVSLFFKRMMGADGKAVVVFFNDVLSTYARIAVRCAEIAKQGGSSANGSGGGGEEQIQLVAEDPSTVIGFEIPDGPPPEHITIEGEMAEKVDVEQVRAHLQRRWDIFQSFTPEFQNALKTKELDRVNAVLGKMKVEEAEGVVALLDEAGILSFSSTEIRDETGK